MYLDDSLLLDERVLLKEKKIADRTGFFSPLSVISPLPTPKQGSLRDVAMRQAQEMLDSGKQIFLLWDGSADSTLVALFFDSLITSSDQLILLTPASAMRFNPAGYKYFAGKYCMENPRASSNYLRSYFLEDSIVVSCKGASLFSTVYCKEKYPDLGLSHMVAAYVSVTNEPEEKYYQLFSDLSAASGLPCGDSLEFSRCRNTVFLFQVCQLTPGFSAQAGVYGEDFIDFFTTPALEAWALAQELGALSQADNYGHRALITEEVAVFNSELIPSRKVVTNPQFPDDRFFCDIQNVTSDWQYLP